MAIGSDSHRIERNAFDDGNDDLGAHTEDSLGTLPRTNSPVDLAQQHRHAEAGEQELRVEQGGARARYPDGRMGSDPGQASPEKGGQIVKASVKALLEEVAAFDVEPLPPDNPLWREPNVIITPHVAAGSDIAPARVWTLVKENLRRYVAGERMLNVVDIDKGY